MLTNYWWILIWIFLAGIVIQCCFSKEPLKVLGKTEYRWSIFATVFVSIPYVIWAGTRKNIGDTNAYRKIFADAPQQLNQIFSYANEIGEDKGFSILTVIMKCIIGNSEVVFFLVIALFQMFCLMYIFRKYSSNLWISLYIFLASCNYISWMFNGIRQFIAVCICFIASEFILEKKYLRACILVLIASTFHGTAIIMLGVFYIAQGQVWNKKTMMFIVITIGALLFIDRFTNILGNVLEGTQYGNVMSGEIWLNDDGTNVLRVLVNAVPAIISFVGRKQIRKSGGTLINMCANMSIIATGIYLISMVTSGIYIGRLPIYMLLYSYILLPWEIENVFTQNSKKIVYVSLLVGYFVFFYYQMHVAYSWI